MKRFLLLGGSLLVCAAAHSQGLQFETGNWSATLAKAKAAQRLVYVDVFAVWCGPCKLLEKEVFPTKEAGDFYNKHFVNVHLNGESPEGILLAKRYGVTAFPTHLFLDPANESVVYWTTGYSGLEGFLENGKTALEEWKDPMTWDKYVASFPAERKNKDFLRRALQKAQRLNKDNTDFLNAYVALLPKQQPADSEVLFLSEQIRTLDNDALPLVDEHPDVLLNSKDATPDILANLHERWGYQTLEKAIRNRDPALIDRIELSFRETMPADAEEKMFYVRESYFNETGDSLKGFQESMREADFFSRKSMDEYRQRDSLNLQDIRANMRWQLKELGVKDDKMEEQIAANLHLHPELLHNASIQAATSLNNIAWRIYEEHARDSALLHHALRWAQQALQLTEFSPEDWCAFADTYAHLLYRNHERDKAIALQQTVVDKVRASGRPPKDIDSYVSELEKMKSGSL